MFLILWTNEYGQPPPTHIEHLPPRKLKDLPTRVAGPAGVDPDPDPASKKKMDAEEADPGPYRPPRKKPETGSYPRKTSLFRIRPNFNLLKLTLNFFV